MDNNNTEIMNTETSHTLCYSITLTTPPGGVVVRVLARGFNSRPFHFQVATLGKLLTHTCASVTKQYNLVPVKGWLFSAAGKVNAGLASHWPCVTDLSGLFTYRLTAWTGR